MKVEHTKAVSEVEKAPAPAERAAGKAPSDKVSVEATRQAEQAIEAARAHAGTSRAAMLQQIEAAVRSGMMRPNAARIAEQLLSAAEIDAKLQAMLKG